MVYTVWIALWIAWCLQPVKAEVHSPISKTYTSQDGLHQLTVKPSTEIGCGESKCELVHVGKETKTIRLAYSYSGACVLADGGVVGFGYKNGANGLGTTVGCPWSKADLFVTRLDSAGNEVWSFSRERATRGSGSMPYPLVDNIWIVPDNAKVLLLLQADIGDRRELLRLDASTGKSIGTAPLSPPTGVEWWRLYCNAASLLNVDGQSLVGIAWMETYERPVKGAKDQRKQLRWKAVFTLHDLQGKLLWEKDQVVVTIDEGRPAIARVEALLQASKVGFAVDKTNVIVRGIDGESWTYTPNGREPQAEGDAKKP